MESKKLRKTILLVLTIEILLIPLSAYLKINHASDMITPMVWGLGAFFLALSIVLIVVWISIQLKRGN